MKFAGLAILKALACGLAAFRAPRVAASFAGGR